MMIKAIAFLALMGTGMAEAAAPDSTNGWGYGYDSLLRDLGEWRKSPHVKVDSIGASVQGRAIWMISITDGSDSVGRTGDFPARKHRVFIHARTHPAEVQAHYVANEAVRFLLDTGSQSRLLRRDFIFNIVPMYNPDGVQIGKPRQNAHGVDLESNWDQQVLEPEVVALKKTFETYMGGPVPIEVALNLHSDQFNCTRFFFFHYAAGTSTAYEDLERKFIGGVQAHFPNGIKNWDFVRSWGDGTQARYPEGFWWKGYHENVLALTYEDTNCPNAGRFDSTGTAIVLGSADYIRDRIVAAVRPLARSGETRMLLLAEGVGVASAAGARWELSDVRGRLMAGGGLGPVNASGMALLPWSRLPAGSGRILSVYGPGRMPERLRLPNRPD
jgi:hypothetical protein